MASTEAGVVHRLCRDLGIEHRLTRPRTPKTNGMVERFNSSLDLAQTLLRYSTLYNHHLLQSALKSKTPIQAMKDWHFANPELLHRRPYDRPGCHSY